MNRLFLIIVIGVASWAALSCTSGDRKRVTSHESVDDETAWIPLFEGKSLDGWHGINKVGPVDNWVVEDGLRTCLGKSGGADIGGDIVAEQACANSELEAER